MLFEFEYILENGRDSSKVIAFVLIMLATFTESKFTTLNVVKGDVAFLNFTYSCNSTEVTLQRGNGAYIYNSKIPTPPLSSNLNLRNETDGKSCFLYLTINPVTRDDEGGYILFAYKDDPAQLEDDRVLLLVSYPPGKTLCSLSEEYIDPDWVRLQCTAPIGTIGGYIMCYQHGIEIPPLNSPQEHDETLSQTLLAKVGDLVYCCSSVLGQTKDMCECKDSVWDPIQNKQVTNVTDPCPPPATNVQYPTFSQQPIRNDEYELTSPSTETLTGTSPQTNSGKALVGLIAVICLLIMAFVILSTAMVHYFMRHRKEKQNSLNRMSRKKPANCEEENGVQEYFISEVQIERV